MIRTRWAAGVAVIALVVLFAGDVQADEATSGAALGRANAAAIAGDWSTAERALAPLAAPSVSLSASDRAELHRLTGLVAFFAKRLDDADRAWLAYLHLDLDGRLDPSTVPPEAISFFEDVRTRHGAELRALRPRPVPPKHWAVLNFVPIAAQLQNREPVRAWIFGGALVTLIGANLATYAVLRSWCDATDGTCDEHRDAARTLRIVNLAAGVGAIATYVFGVVDGFRGHARRTRLVVERTPTGGMISLARRF